MVYVCIFLVQNSRGSGDKRGMQTTGYDPPHACKQTGYGSALVCGPRGKTVKQRQKLTKSSTFDRQRLAGLVFKGLGHVFPGRGGAVERTRII